MMVNCTVSPGCVCSTVYATTSSIPIIGVPFIAVMTSPPDGQLRPVDHGKLVRGAQAGFFCCGSRAHRQNQSAARFGRQIHGTGNIRTQRDATDADERVLVPAFRYERRRHQLRQVYGYGQADTGKCPRLADDLGVDADDFAIAIQEWSARIPGICSRVMLHHPGNREIALGRIDGPAHGADDARCHREPPRERIADRHRQLARLD